MSVVAASKKKPPVILRCDTRGATRRVESLEG